MIMLLAIHHCRLGLHYAGIHNLWICFPTQLSTCDVLCGAHKLLIEHCLIFCLCIGDPGNEARIWLNFDVVVFMMVSFLLLLQVS